MMRCAVVCPITGKRWHDKGTVLGVAIYHAPRFLSKLEQTRALDEEMSAAKQNKQRKLTRCVHVTDLAVQGDLCLHA